MNYQQRIRDLREDKNLKQKDIALLLDIDQSYYAKYENGKHPLPIDHLKRLCVFYDITADYILGFTNDPKPLPKK